jgi:predicted ester cyclase
MKQFTPPQKASPDLSLEEMKDFVRNHFEQFVNNKDSSTAFRSFSNDFLDHDESAGVQIGPEPAKQMMEAAYARWTDLNVSIEDIIAEGDKVMVRNIWRASEAGSGKHIEFSGFVLWRFAKGKIVERWATITPPTAID